MRKEFFDIPSPPFLFGPSIIFVLLTALIGSSIADRQASSSSEQISQTLFIVFFFLCVVWMASAMWRWQKRSNPPPPPLLLITIDDSGLWLREVGELMRWSEIQSVNISYWGQASCTIVWRHNSIRLHDPERYRDRDGQAWVAPSVYREIKSYWKRCGTAAELAAPRPFKRCGIRLDGARWHAE